MVITNTIGAVLRLFVADPTKSYNIREIAKKIGINYRLVYDAVLVLEKENFLKIESIGNLRVCSFVPAGNILFCLYAEAERTEKFLGKHLNIKLLKQEIDKKTSTVYDTILIFGSYAQEKQTITSDIDVLCIIPHSLKKTQYEQNMRALVGMLNYKIDLNIMTEKEFIDGKKEQSLNIVKEVIPNHIILRGAEQFHYLLSR